ncbi:MAG: hypothetical protein KDD58_09510 [Bdellovibrionales bacterium]|nr:hypothetical protein [Bdellovibrionales bacterium]
MKWFIPILALILALLLIGSAHQSLAAARNTASKKVTCSYGGQFKHSSADAHMARKMTTDACFEAQLEIFEQQRGQLPGDDQADLMIESCVNKTSCS